MENYRPISLVSTTSKILEKIILDRLNAHYADRLPMEQFGFTKGKSTSLQLLRTTEFINAAHRNKETVMGVFLDFQKAFDTVWHRGLIYKLITNETPTWITKIIYSYLINRIFQVKSCGMLSRVAGFRAGVPQGSILAPLLYNIYTYDIPRKPNIVLSIYADDTDIFSHNRNYKYATIALRKYLAIVYEWCQQWQLKVNHNKSQCIVFRKQNGRAICNEITMGGHQVPYTDCVKYLGLNID